MPAPTGSPKRARVLAAVIGVVIALGTLELCMQIGAYVLWARMDREVEAIEIDEGSRRILCLGDSFTWGLGAEDRSGSYPAQLAAKLETDSPGRWSVVNLGRPGQNSAECVQRIDGQLATYRPDLVVVLIGCNDPFSTDVVQEAADVGSREPFEWQWRTLRLVGRIGHALFGRDSVEPRAVVVPDHPKELLGVWHRDGIELAFSADGQLSAGGFEHRWRVEQGVLHYGDPEGGEDRATWAIEGEELVLQPLTHDVATIRLRRGPVPLDAETRARVAIAAADWEGAAELIESVEGDRAGALRMLLAARRGDAATADRLLEQLRGRVDASAEVARCAASVLYELEQWERGTEIALAGLRRFPSDHELWRLTLDVVVQHQTMRRSVDPVLDIALAEVSEPNWFRASLHSAKVWVADYGSADLVDVVEHALRADCLRGDERQTLSLMRRRPERVTSDIVRAAAARLDPATGIDDRLIAILLEAQSSRKVDGTELERHLRQIADRVHAAGAELVLLTYPESTYPALDAVPRRLGSEAGIHTLDLQPTFAALLHDTPWEDLFIADGHCNGEGYGVMAAEVHEWLRQR